MIHACSDALVALGRITAFLTAEELETPYVIDDGPDNELGVRVDGSFTWEAVEKAEAKFVAENEKAKEDDKEVEREKPVKTSKRWFSRKAKSNEAKTSLPAPATSSVSAPEPVDPRAISTNIDEEKGSDEPEPPFALTDLSLRIPKGKFVAIVGRVGSGKSSLLQSLVGEMRKTNGEVVFGGKVAYAPQQPWILNATLRENILFGRKDDREKCVFTLVLGFRALIAES